jgi:broad specificity phosphatase PhoE
MAVALVMIRHAPTPWNAAKKLQGRTDISLGEAGRSTAAQWRIDPAWSSFRILSSPLARARETAAILFPRTEIDIESRLIEMDFGAWEGKSLQDLRGAPGSDAAERETLGLDFRAPEGESPRDVQHRLMPLFLELASARRNTVAVTHKAVLRATYALATDWQMQEKPPQKLKNACAHVFTLDESGMPRIDRLNIPLAVDAA